MEKFFKDSRAEEVLEAETLALGFAKWLLSLSRVVKLPSSCFVV